MAKVVLPATLMARVDADGPFDIDAPTAGDVLGSLERQEPSLRGWILDETGRLREHVSLFVNDERSGLQHPVGAADELFVVQAISGGRPAGDADRTELLLGTKKGLFVLRGARGSRLAVAHREFAGQAVDYACRDPRSGTYFAAMSHGQFGPHLYRAEDPAGQWSEVEGLAFPEDADAAVLRIWVVEPGEGEGELWAGVAPAALFHSTDGGRAWSLNRGLWDVPGRAEWEGGLGGLCLHSICPWPGDPQRLAVGISAAGVWRTEDGGQSWRWGVAGLVPGYLPAEARADTTMFCVHKLLRSPVEPRTLYMQFHGGVYRSDNEGRAWHDIGVKSGLPAEFGFPLVVDPHDADHAFVIPLVADTDRVTPEGRVRVYETTDRGASWRSLEDGLPQKDAYLTVLRQAFCHDGRDPLGLYFGCRTGDLFGSVDSGASWRSLADHLPPILSVRSAS